MSAKYTSQRHPGTLSTRGQLTHLTAREIGERLGISGNRVSEIEQRALYKIRTEIQRQLDSERLSLSEWAGLD